MQLLASVQSILFDAVFSSVGIERESKRIVIRLLNNGAFNVFDFKVIKIYFYRCRIVIANINIQKPASFARKVRER